MSEDAKVNLVLYFDLSRQEQEKLERIEGDVVRHVLAGLGRNDRPIWSSRAEKGLRFVRLSLADRKKTVLMEVAADEFVGMSQEELLSKLEQSGQR